jgi:Family of unknown function (DUF5693)
LTRPSFPSWVYVAAIASLLVASFSVYRRYQAETANRATELASEYETIEALAAGQGISIDDAIESLKAQGLTTLVINEETIGEMISSGSLILESTAIPQKAGLPINLSAIRFRDPTMMSRVQRGLNIRFGALMANSTPREDLLALPAVSANLVRQTGIGLPPVETGYARRHGLRIVARSGNVLGSTNAAVASTLEWLHDSGASVFLALGDQMVGRRDGIDNAIASLRKFDLLYATAEFTKIGDDANVVSTAPDLVIRLHSAQVAELDKLSNADAVERYVKAARERNMRILLVRPLDISGPQPLAAYGEFLKSIGDGIRTQGGEVGLAKPFIEPNVPRPVILTLAVLGAALLFGLLSATVSKPQLRTASAIFCAVVAAASVTKFGLHLNALLLSMAFPTLGFIVLDHVRFRTWPDSVRIPTAFLMISAFSLLGGLYVAGLLNGLAYYIKADEFLGIKISVFVPILVVAAVFATRWTDWKKTLATGITWGSALLGLVLIAALGIMIARTGNDGGVGASDGELLFRSALEQFLHVRPRTKEFLVGHPALWIALGMYFRYMNTEKIPTEKLARLRSWTILALALGAVGQTDIVNTLCHLHIPVVLSVVRVTLGIVLGCIVGSVLWAVVARFLPTDTGSAKQGAEILSGS